ncbi:DNA recombination protein RecN [Nocardia exalbida]|uniref:DNA recombination protein RecN n=1 Tax=Nocardia exalbida TaxID=290231 RepID=UPI0002DB5118|nr:DNA recombination protein RecN [Nocardia exalbida]
MATSDANRGIRLAELRLGGLAATSRSYQVDFRDSDRVSWRPLSVIAGPSQTGKTSVIDFVRYCMGDTEHPQHPEVLAAVRAALLETSLAGRPVTIERAATGPASKFASVWQASLDSLTDTTELRLPIEPTSEPSGLSQFLLAACGLDNVELPTSPKQPESATQMLSIRDLFRVMWLPNERLDSKNLLFEHSNFVVRQKLQQTIDVMFDVHDADGNDLASRLKMATDAAREADRAASALRAIVQDEHPLGPLVLETDRERAKREAQAISAQLAQLDRSHTARGEGITELRQALAEAQVAARDAAVRVRNRESLMERLAALRGQYADDKKKLTFLKEAERLFDPLQVSVCPVCLSELENGPVIVDGACSLCGHNLPDGDSAQRAPSVGLATTGHEDVGSDTGGRSFGATAVLEAELKATTRRLDELNDYWNRLDRDLSALRSAQEIANSAAQMASAAVDRIIDTPAPYLAVRDDLGRRRSDALLREQEAAAGLRLWERVRRAEEVAERLAGQAARLRAERSATIARPDRTAVVQQLSARFGEVLAAIGYPKLSDPRLDERLTPYVRGLPYTAASSGGLVLISLAWYLALWEVAYETGARAPGLLIIDSPQKNLGHGAHPDEPDFADTRLVENFYRHVKDWLSGPGAGAQLVVVDNSPPDLVAEDVVVRYSRNHAVPPYGLIDDAID